MAESRSLIRLWQRTTCQTKRFQKLNGITNVFLEFAEQRAQRHIITTMAEWKQRLEQFLATMDYQVQDSAGKVSQEEAREKAYGEYEKYKVIQDRSFISDFDRFNNGDKLLRLISIPIKNNDYDR